MIRTIVSTPRKIFITCEKKIYINWLLEGELITKKILMSNLILNKKII